MREFMFSHAWDLLEDFRREKSLPEYKHKIQRKKNQRKRDKNQKRTKNNDDEPKTRTRSRVCSYSWEFQLDSQPCKTLEHWRRKVNDKYLGFEYIEDGTEQIGNHTVSTFLQLKKKMSMKSQK